MSQGTLHAGPQGKSRSCVQREPTGQAITVIVIEKRKRHLRQRKRDEQRERERDEQRERRERETYEKRERDRQTVCQRRSRVYFQIDWLATPGAQVSGGTDSCLFKQGQGALLKHNHFSRTFPTFWQTSDNQAQEIHRRDDSSHHSSQAPHVQRNFRMDSQRGFCHLGPPWVFFRIV